MKKKELEILLQKVPPHPLPDPALEQYVTPASAAADILFDAYLRGDVEGKSVVDLGCGTGIFSIGAKILGAAKVVGIDIDESSIDAARLAANSLLPHVSGRESAAVGGGPAGDAEDNGAAEADAGGIEFLARDVASLDVKECPCDTVFQNPPFGAQKKGADRVFLEKASSIAGVVYTLHQTNTEPFIRLLSGKLAMQITHEKRYIFPIKHMFAFHTSAKKDFPVTLFRMEKTNRR